MADDAELIEGAREGIAKGAAFGFGGEDGLDGGIVELAPPSIGFDSGEQPDSCVGGEIEEEDAGRIEVFAKIEAAVEFAEIFVVQVALRICPKGFGGMQDGERGRAGVRGEGAAAGGGSKDGRRARVLMGEGMIIAQGEHGAKAHLTGMRSAIGEKNGLFVVQEADGFLDESAVEVVAPGGEWASTKVF